MIAPKSRTSAVVLFAVQLTLVYLGARAVSWIDLVIDVGGDKALEELAAAVTRVTLEAALPILLSTLVVFGANLSISRSLLVPGRHRSVISILSLTIIAVGYLATANLAATAVEPATLVQLLVTAAAVQFEVGRQPDTFTATLPFIFINAFFGIYLVNVPPTFAAVFPALAALVVYNGARVAKSAASPQWRYVATAIAGVFSITILVKSLIEYQAGKSVAYAPLDSPWRSLYFAIVLTGYAAVALSYRSASTSDARRRVGANLWLASAMLCAIPILICFTPHGILLLLGSAAWLVIAFAICRFRLARADVDGGADAAIAILLLLTLFALLTADRLVHLDPTAYLSPVIFLPVAWGGAIGLIFGAVLPIVLGSIRSTRKWVCYELKSLRQLRGGAQVIVVVGASVVLLAACFLFYAGAAAYAQTQNEPSNVFDLRFATLPIKGFGGVNAWSWAAVAFALNLVVFASIKIAPFARDIFFPREEVPQ